MQAPHTICFTDLLKSKMGRHRALDTVVVSEWRVSLPPFEETIEFLKRGHKVEARWHQGFFLESKTIPLRKSWEMHQVFSLCKAFEEGAQTTDDVETLMSVTGVPWDPQATKLDEVPLPQIVQGDQ